MDKVIKKRIVRSEKIADNSFFSDNQLAEMISFFIIVMPECLHLSNRRQR